MARSLNSSKESNIESTATSRYMENLTGANEHLSISAGVQRSNIRLLHGKLGKQE